MRVILFNGPPRSGKDTAAGLSLDILAEMGLFPAPYKLAEPLKDAVHAAFGLNVAHDHFEETKDIPNEIFLGSTPREAYISMSEDYLKRVYGQEFFGHAAVNYLKQLTNMDLVVVSDCGFIEEVKPLINYAGRSNVAIVQIIRDGTNFHNDSRSYVSIDDVPTYRIRNNGTIDDLKGQLQELISFIMDH